MNRDEEDDQSLLAAEYVIGLLPQLSRRRIEHRMRREAQLRAKVAFWEDRLGHLNKYYGAQPVSPSVKAAIDARLFRKLQNSVVAGLLALSLVALTSVFALQTNKLERTSTELHNPSTGYRFAVSVSSDRTDIEIKLNDGRLPEGHSFELWIIATGEMPRSLGAFSHESKKTLPDGLPSGSTIAVSLEPLNGSLTGLPTGDVLAAGRLPPD